MCLFCGMLFRFFVGLVCCSCFFSCKEVSQLKDVANDTTLPNGAWRAVLDLTGELNPEGVELPFNMQVYQKDGATFVDVINAEERITIDDIRVVGDSLYLRLPLFNSEIQCVSLPNGQLQGQWKNFNKKDYALPFHAEPNQVHRFCEREEGATAPAIRGKYEVHFGLDDDESYYPAIGQFYTNDTNNRVTGTFMTETGDYRFLEGNYCDGKVFLSCFDGSHAFHFEADVVGDSLTNGYFRSGKHWKEKWVGVKNANASLTDPHLITKIVDSTAMKGLSFPASDGTHYVIGDKSHEGEVTILQIMGTWCPNCIDETLVFKDFYEKYHEQGLNIVPLAFEAQKEADAALAVTDKLRAKLDLPYQIYYGGYRSKTVAHERLPFLSSVCSFPTSIILDKKGRVRDVHTGFYGPGTMDYYERHIEKTENLLLTLLNEEL